MVHVPVPAAGTNDIVVETRATVISAGTERMLVSFGRAGLIQKARSQPEKVRQVLDKVRTDGLRPTLEAVRSKLQLPIPLGYCQSGVVVDAGADSGFKIGDRVATNGNHAEYVRIPRLLAAKIPDGVGFVEAAFTPVAAIGLQAIRNANPTLGETFVVYGLGLIGLLTAQLLHAHGCRVLGIDQSKERLALARECGVTVVDNDGDVVAAVLASTEGVGADAVLLTLASDSDEPIARAAAMTRKKGRLVLVGVTGLHLTRDLFYKKELSFTVSCSYGAGRYDHTYEQGGRDYPLPYVRWTAQRNFEAVLRLMARGMIDVQRLVTREFAFDDACDAYDLLASRRPSLGLVLRYRGSDGAEPLPSDRTLVRSTSTRDESTSASIGVVGAGNFAVRTFVPALRHGGAHLCAIASSGGTAGAIAAEKFGFDRATTDVESLLNDPGIDGIAVLTRHDSHASLAQRAIEAGKHVFVEKPLALTEGELDSLETALEGSSATLTVGFNRRFAPMTQECKTLLQSRVGPLVAVVTVNAGHIPRDHWVHDGGQGGGRIIGEACHFVDLTRSLAGSRIISTTVQAAKDSHRRTVDDIAVVLVGFEDGSAASIHYLANGARTFPKERVECFYDEKTLVIDNWRRLRRFGVRKPFLGGRRRMDKGHRALVTRWLATVRNEAPPPMPADEILEVSRWSVRAGEAARDRVQ